MYKNLSSTLSSIFFKIRGWWFSARLGTFIETAHKTFYSSILGAFRYGQTNVNSKMMKNFALRNNNKALLFISMVIVKVMKSKNYDKLEVNNISKNNNCIF